MEQMNCVLKRRSCKSEHQSDCKKRLPPLCPTLASHTHNNQKEGCKKDEVENEVLQNLRTKKLNNEHDFIDRTNNQQSNKENIIPCKHIIKGDDHDRTFRKAKGSGVGSVAPLKVAQQESKQSTGVLEEHCPNPGKKTLQGNTVIATIQANMNTKHSKNAFIIKKRNSSMREAVAAKDSNAKPEVCVQSENNRQIIKYRKLARGVNSRIKSITIRDRHSIETPDTEQQRFEIDNLNTSNRSKQNNIKSDRNNCPNQINESFNKQCTTSSTPKDEFYKSPKPPMVRKRYGNVANNGKKPTIENEKGLSNFSTGLEKPDNNWKEEAHSRQRSGQNQEKWAHTSRSKQRSKKKIEECKTRKINWEVSATKKVEDDIFNLALSEIHEVNNSKDGQTPTESLKELYVQLV